MTPDSVDVVRRPARSVPFPVVGPAYGAGRARRSPVESYMFANTGSDDVPDLGASDTPGLTGRE